MADTYTVTFELPEGWTLTELGDLREEILQFAALHPLASRCGITDRLDI